MVAMGNYDMQNSSQFLNTRKSIECLKNIVFRVLSYLLQQFVRTNDEGLCISKNNLSYRELYRTFVSKADSWVVGEAGS
jgi:hypothetical protein